LKKLWKYLADKESKDIWKSCKMEEDYRKKALNEVNNLGLKQIHYGRGHIGNSQKSKLPEKLLVLLWILRFTIYDENTLRKLKIFFSPDCIADPRNNPSAIFDPEWLKFYIVIPFTSGSVYALV
jgi:hypothetical protein